MRFVVLSFLVLAATPLAAAAQIEDLEGRVDVGFVIEYCEYDTGNPILRPLQPDTAVHCQLQH